MGQRAENDNHNKKKLNKSTKYTAVQQKTETHLEQNGQRITQYVTNPNGNKSDNTDTQSFVHMIKTKDTLTQDNTGSDTKEKPGR